MDKAEQRFAEALWRCGYTGWQAGPCEAAPYEWDYESIKFDVGVCLKCRRPFPTNWDDSDPDAPTLMPRHQRKVPAVTLELLQEMRNALRAGGFGWSMTYHPHMKEPSFIIWKGQKMLASCRAATETTAFIEACASLPKPTE